jgi:hypothetical protein
MSEQYKPNIGELCHEGARRDAIHFAVAPVVAGQDFLPGQHVEIEDGRWVAALEGEGVGIVDPFLRQPVRIGDRFWLFLYPNTITDLRHVWSHPAFAPKPPVKP